MALMYSFTLHHQKVSHQNKSCRPAVHLGGEKKFILVQNLATVSHKPRMITFFVHLIISGLEQVELAKILSIQDVHVFLLTCKCNTNSRHHDMELMSQVQVSSVNTILENCQHKLTRFIIRCTKYFQHLLILFLYLEKKLPSEISKSLLK